MTSTRVEIPVFNGNSDFSLWKIRIMAHIGTLGLKEAMSDFTMMSEVPVSKKDQKKGEDGVEESSTEVKLVLDPVKEERSEQARNVIILHVGDAVLRKINHCKTAAEMWRTLNSLYMETSLPNRINLQIKFYSFKMLASQTIDQNVDDFLKIVSELGSLEITVPEEVKAILVLNALPPSFSQLKHTLKYGNKELSVNDVVSHAKSLEKEMLEQKDSEKGSSSSALYTTERGRSQNKKDSQERGRSRSKSKSKVTCWFCKKEGHLKKDCYARKKKFERESQGEAGVVTEKLVFSEALVVGNKAVNDVWVLDSGCTSHMTSRRDWFCSYTEGDDTTILLGDNRAIKSQGIGSIRVDTHGGSIKILNNVKYVPELRRNLISTGTLDRLGYKHEGGAGKVRYLMNNVVALSGELVNGLYILDGDTVTTEVQNVEVSKKTSVNLWHSRLGHLSLNNMKILGEKGLIQKKDIKNLDFCEHCVLGKSKKLSFNVAKHNAPDLLSYVHADLWGAPSTTPSLSGNIYFLSVIDDKSRKVWLHFMKTKDETFTKFCEWKQLVENQVNKKVKCLRTDNGLEFCNEKFDSFCKANGIERHRTCAYTPQQNGVAERMNRTIMEKVRCLLSESGLEEAFWAEAAAIAVYIINRSPSSAIDHNVPEELWLNRKPGYKHMRRFGSLAYVHHNQGKLKPRALKGIFLGYPSGTKGYKIWLLDEEKCTISRNVTFHEDQVYKDLKVQDNVENAGTDAEECTKKESILSFPKQGGVSQASDQLDTVSDSVNSEDEGSAEAEDTEGEVSTPDAAEGTSSNYQLARDRPRREVVPPVRFQDYTHVAYALMMCEEVNLEEEPGCYHDAQDDKDWSKWSIAMEEEMNSLAKNETWILVDRPKDKQVIGCRWIYRLKSGIPGIELLRHKARLVARGFTQREGVDYQDIFAPVVKHTSIRILLSIVVNEDLELQQMDVKTAFLHGDLEEELYMEQPEGYISEKGKDKVCLLKKSLYGLKQSPRMWNKRFDRFMVTEGFVCSDHDPCVYVKTLGPRNCVYLLLYVDDMLIAAKDMSEINKLKRRLGEDFEMKDMGAASKMLGIEISRNRKEGTLCLSQSEYLNKVLKRFNMSNSKAVASSVGSHFKLSSVKDPSECINTDKVPYSSAVGSIMYSMIGTRLDLAYGIGLMSRFMSKPGKMHWEALKWLMRYIKGSHDLKLVYTQGKDLSIVGYCDSDFAADLDRRRSISGYVFTVGGNTISWKSSLQHIVALSTTEAEYVALTDAIKEAIWIKGLLGDLGYIQEKAMVWCDSQSAICLSKNSVYHERTKHIAVKRSFLKEVTESGEVEVHKIHTSKNPADILTKGVSVSKVFAALELLKLVKHA